jgi:hypothetical protein
LQQILHHSEVLKKLKMHCQALEEIRVFMVEVHGLAQPYLQLAAAKYRINIGEHFDNLTKVTPEELYQLLADPHVRTILPSALRAERFKEIQQERGEVCDEGGAASNEELWRAEMELQRQKEEVKIRQELVDLKEQYKQQETQLEELNRVIEYTRQRASTMEEDIEKKREQNRRQARQAAVKNAPKTVKRVASLTSKSRHQSDTLQNVDMMYVWSEEEDNPEMGGGNGEATEGKELNPVTLDAWFDSRDAAEGQPDLDQVQPVHILPDNTGLVQRSRYSASTGKATMRPNTAPVDISSGGYFFAGEDETYPTDGQVMTHVTPFHVTTDPMKGILKHMDDERMRPVTAPRNSVPQSHPDRLEAEMRITKAEIERMERMHSAAIRENQRRKQMALQGNADVSAEQQESIEQMRARREKKNLVIVDSDSTSSGLLSPRDKPMRKDVVRRELEKKQRAAEDRANGKCT